MGPNEPRLTSQTLKVLGVLMSRPSDDISGAEIARITQMKSGTLYPILVRLEAARWVESKWEKESPQDLGRPRRRFYQLTGLGMRNARSAFRDITSLIGGFAWR